MSTSPHSSPEEFLKAVPGVFALANEGKNSVNLSVKRLVKRDPVEGNDEFNATELPLYDVSKKSQFTKVPQDANNLQYDVLVRIKKGSGEGVVKHSTVVKADALDKFWKEYSAAIKSGMTRLVKKKKKKVKVNAKKSQRK
ncbi:LAQU0S04e07008g1_1 [Lachancea quebecensis]|uniref:Signal recognition particle subunit SRP14 n=1 Tax=Lachancea quebecensis TaxID=1654605 RepID=A0A0P1KPZ6_9SACH|nr:LAQU0S04e07008g1_1 [Lachancea quebecensis]